MPTQNKEILYFREVIAGVSNFSVTTFYIYMNVKIQNIKKKAMIGSNNYLRIEEYHYSQLAPLFIFLGPKQ